MAIVITVHEQIHRFILVKLIIIIYILRNESTVPTFCIYENIPIFVDTTQLFVVFSLSTSFTGQSGFEIKDGWTDKELSESNFFFFVYLH